ncbi:hypothetical protein GOP47_0009776 [Adiantum capillus-veneris]|uniref:Leucine-rich repeat-containing N-terminal plant-type domain-containing protein n=1 Tax=Adiantum capillus-veneris TaxID=13818 RepID=A0A9D4ZJZ9_ADICA|nr:hypothetical protein GOP47_0009776 [Adiantum capillus-veneris]
MSILIALSQIPWKKRLAVRHWESLSCADLRIYVGIVRKCNGLRLVAGPFLCILALSILSQALAEDDSQCLQEFKASVKDPTNHQSNWIFGNSSKRSDCNFIGVLCWNTGENKVLAIKIQNAGLEGSFASGLTQCTALQNLALWQNGFTGSIPNVHTQQSLQASS